MLIWFSQVRMPSEMKTSLALLCTPKCSMITWCSGTSLVQSMDCPPGSSSLALRSARSSRWPSNLVKCWTLKFWQSVICTPMDRGKCSVRWTDSWGQWWWMTSLSLRYLVLRTFYSLFALENGIGRFPIKYRKTKTQVITPANYKERRQSNEPIKTRS